MQMLVALKDGLKIVLENLTESYYTIPALVEIPAWTQMWLSEAETTWELARLTT